MADLTAAGRRALPASEFGLPEQRKYPTDTRGRAVAAKAYAAKEHNVGKLSAGQEAQIDRKANAKLGEAHPREHALTMASADHLHRKGYIGSEQHKAIRDQAQAKMAMHKAGRTFGSLG